MDGEGDIAITAGDDILLNANAETAFGQFLLIASNGNNEDILDTDANDGVVMQANVSITAGNNNNVLVRAAGATGDVRLGLIDAGSGQVVVLADDDILDSNFAFAPQTVNLIGQDVQLIADADNNLSLIHI